MACRRHIRTKYDNDPCANTFIRCNCCGSWSNALYSVNCCCECGCEFDGTETTQRGIYPPGWGEDESWDE